MSDPANVYALDDIRTITNRDVQPLVATAADVERAIQKFAGMDGQVEALASVAAEAIEGEDEQMEAALEDAPIVKLVNAIMTQAVGDRASDVHIEPAEKNVRIRFRVDGVLHEPMPPAPKNIQGGLISRLKVMADLNIAEKRIPQDGRISMKVGGKQLDLRARDPAHRLRREGRHPHPGQVQRPARAGGPRASWRSPTSSSRGRSRSRTARSW